MKTLVLSLITLFYLTSSLQAQNQKQLRASLWKDLMAYRECTLAADFDKVFSFMPPKMFDVIPRDSLETSMEAAMNNEMMEVQLTRFDFDPKLKLKIKITGPYYWTKVPYTGAMRLTIKAESGLKAMLIPLLKSQFGADNVQMENDSTMQIAFKNKELVAYKDPTLPNWSLIEDKRSEPGPAGEQQKELFKAIIPNEVLKAIDKQ
jgi:hypothetical protein